MNLWRNPGLFLNPGSIQTGYFTARRFSRKAMVTWTCGVFEEWFPDESRTTLLHDVFDNLAVVLTELANFSDWLEIEIFLAGH